MSNRHFTYALAMVFVLSQTAVAQTVPSQTAGSQTPAKKALTGSVNINQAGIAELTLLPGIGPKKGQAIVEYAKAHPFKTVDELKEIKGIGDKALEKLKPHVTVSGPTTLQD